MKTVSINLYSFNELSERAQEKAIRDHIEFLDSLPEEYEEEDGQIVSEYIEHTKEDAIDSIEANEYIFYEDGSLARCVTYTGKHPKAGITELNFKGRIYQL